jgi:lysozyme
MATSTRKKTPPKSKSSSKFSWGKVLLVGILFLGLLVTVVRYKNAILYYFSFKSKHSSQRQKVEKARINQIFKDHPHHSAGIDISEYQGTIDWDAVDSLEGRSIRFVFVRATCGKNRKDRKFIANWNGAKKFVRGAYHYYRPDENSIEQAQKFCKTVRLEPGDLPPVLDIEKLPKNQSLSRLKVGLKKWLDAVEAHYGVKPIIYTCENYYASFLKDEFSDYPFWIANYNFYVAEIEDDWLFWQFSEKAIVEGIPEKVDVNLYNGTPKMLGYLTQR